MADGVKRASDKYRSFLHEERGNIQWRHGAAPTYDAVNELFEQGRTQVRTTSYRSLACIFVFDYIICESEKDRNKKQLKNEDGDWRFGY